MRVYPCHFRLLTQSRFEHLIYDMELKSARQEIGKGYLSATGKRLELATWVVLAAAGAWVLQMRLEHIQPCAMA
jgi:hypothetical protein